MIYQGATGNNAVATPLRRPRRLKACSPRELKAGYTASGSLPNWAQSEAVTAFAPREVRHRSRQGISRSSAYKIPEHLVEWVRVAAEQRQSLADQQKADAHARRGTTNLVWGWRCQARNFALTSSVSQARRWRQRSTGGERETGRAILGIIAHFAPGRRGQAPKPGGCAEGAGLEGVPGMGIELEVKVLRGARW